MAKLNELARQKLSESCGVAVDSTERTGTEPTGTWSLLCDVVNTRSVNEDVVKCIVKNMNSEPRESIKLRVSSYTLIDEAALDKFLHDLAVGRVQLRDVSVE